MDYKDRLLMKMQEVQEGVCVCVSKDSHYKLSIPTLS